MGKVIISTHIPLDGIIGPSPDEWAILGGESERHKFDQLLAADAFQVSGSSRVREATYLGMELTRSAKPVSSVMVGQTAARPS